MVVMLWEKRWEVKGRREGAGDRGLFSWLVEGSFGVRGPGQVEMANGQRR